MAERVFLRIRNWDRFQHYKNRNPPWIKLYNSMLYDIEFNELPDATRYHAIAIMMLASCYQNKIPYDPKWVRSKISAKSPKVDLDALLSVGFLEFYDDASKTLATSCYQDASTEQSRAEGEREQSRAEQMPSGGLNGFEEFYQHYPKKTGRLEAEKAWKKISPGKELSAIIKSAIKNQVKAEHFLGSDGNQYYKNPATWLNQGCWMDSVVHRKTQEEVQQEKKAEQDKRYQV